MTACRGRSAETTGADSAGGGLKAAATAGAAVSATGAARSNRSSAAGSGSGFSGRVSAAADGTMLSGSASALAAGGGFKRIAGAATAGGGLSGKGNGATAGAGVSGSRNSRRAQDQLEAVRQRLPIDLCLALSDSQLGRHVRAQRAREQEANLVEHREVDGVADEQRQLAALESNRRDAMLLRQQPRQNLTQAGHRGRDHLGCRDRQIGRLAEQAEQRLLRQQPELQDGRVEGPAQRLLAVLRELELLGREPPLGDE